VIIFGIRGGKRQDHGPAMPVVCPNCNNQTFYRSLTVTKWFTLFFIPVLPISSKHYLMCPMCTRATQLDHQGRERAAKLVELTAMFQAGSIEADEYARRLQELGTPVGTLPPSVPPGALPPPPA
jgi:hypothetical protein